MLIYVGRPPGANFLTCAPGESTHFSSFKVREGRDSERIHRFSPLPPRFTFERLTLRLVGIILFPRRQNSAVRAQQEMAAVRAVQIPLGTLDQR